MSLAVESGLRTLGYDSIKLEQLAAVASLLKGEDVFMSVPTGFGKSLVYQILPYYSDILLRSCGPTVSGVPAASAVVIVSPLISLMQDQVSKLTSRGIKAVCIAGEHRHDVYSDIMEGRVTHVFSSPEALVGNKTWRSLFCDDRFSRRLVHVALAIDEAHCIMKW